jgi:hypothetical protein
MTVLQKNMQNSAKSRGSCVTMVTVENVPFSWFISSAAPQPRSPGPGALHGTHRHEHPSPWGQPGTIAI